MDKEQAEVQAQMIMRAQLEKQAAVQYKLALAVRVLRLSTPVTVIGFAAGGAVGYFAGLSIFRLGLVGGLIGFFLCRVCFWALSRRAIAAENS